MRNRNKNMTGYTLVEMLMVLAIFTIMLAGGFGALTSGQSAWFATDAYIELQENLRQSIEKMTREHSESGFDNTGVAQYSITDGGGANGSDILKFSMPVLCHNGDSIIDASSNISHWGAPLTWGCTQSSCMDADNVCATVEYKYISYLIGNNNQLLRRVLDPANNIVREDVVGQDIKDLQLTVSADQKVVTLNITAQRKSATGRMLSASNVVSVYFRNRG